MDSERELKLLRFLCQIDDRLNRVRDADGAIALGLRMVREFFEADASCLAVLLPGRERVELRMRQPGNAAPFATSRPDAPMEGSHLNTGSLKSSSGPLKGTRNGELL